MVICATCGTSIKDVKPDISGDCGKCHKDDWFEYTDLGLYVSNQWYKKVRKLFNNIGDVIALVAKSDNITEHNIVIDIFTEKFDKEIIKALQ